MQRAFPVASLALAVSLLGACGEKNFTQPMTLAGQNLSADVLQEGHDVYMHYCRACHGDKGDGNGPAALGLRPKPRDFTKGAFKFLSVANGELPTDADLERIITHGLMGSAMLPWDIDKRELHAVIQYIKSFKAECPPDKTPDKCRSRWERAKAAGEPIPASEDPYKTPEQLAKGVELGKKLYHAKGCANCHPNYVTAQEMYELTKDRPEGPVMEMRVDAYLPILTEAKPFGMILPPDFTFRPLRSGTGPEGAVQASDIYRTIASGVGPMPKWKGVVTEEELWALVHYVKSLADLRDTPEAYAMWRKLDEQPAWKPPAPPPPAEPTPTSAPTTQPAAPAPASPPAP